MDRNLIGWLFCHSPKLCGCYLAVRQTLLNLIWLAFALCLLPIYLLYIVIKEFFCSFWQVFYELFTFRLPNMAKLVRFAWRGNQEQ